MRDEGLFPATFLPMYHFLLRGTKQYLYQLKFLSHSFLNLFCIAKGSSFSLMIPLYFFALKPDKVFSLYNFFSIASMSFLLAPFFNINTIFEYFLLIQIYFYF